MAAAAGAAGIADELYVSLLGVVRYAVRFEHALITNTPAIIAANFNMPDMISSNPLVSGTRQAAYQMKPIEADETAA